MVIFRLNVIAGLFMLTACSAGALAPRAALHGTQTSTAGTFSGLRSGGKPTRFSLAPFIDFAFAAGSTCSFGVNVHYIKANETVTSFPPAADGTNKQIVSGDLIIEFSNVSTGKSLVENVSGPFTLIMHPDGSASVIQDGTGWWPFFSTDHPPSDIKIFTGLTYLHFSTDFQLTLDSTTTPPVDLCAALS